MNKKAIVYAIDDSVECLLQLVTSLKSVRKFCKEPIDIFILTNKQKSWMNDLYDTKIVDVSYMVEKYGLNKMGIIWRKREVPPMLLFRLLIPLVPELKWYDQVLYLDTDTEVWSSEFFNIFSKDSNCEIIGVKDSLSKIGVANRIAGSRSKGSVGWKDDPGIFNRWGELLTGTGKYVNSGVLVFNMDKFKSEDYDARVRYIIDKVRELKPYYSDQDAINVYYRVFAVDDRRYNGWGRKMTSMILRHYVGNERKKFGVYPLPDGRRPSSSIDKVEEDKNLGVFSGVVDKIYVLASDNNYANLDSIGEWLALNGVLKYTVVNTSATEKYKGLVDIVARDKGFKPEHIDNWVGHYKAIIDALGSKCEKIAIFEDTFMPRDLERYLKDLPDTFDIAICTDGDGMFKRTTMFGASSSKGYIISKKCMVDLRRLFEGLWDQSIVSRKLRYVHKWLSSKILVKPVAFTRSNDK